MVFNVDEDNETLPPGVVSREASERMLDLTGTRASAVEAQSRDQFLAAVTDPESTKLRTKWTPTEVTRLATQEAWAYGQRHGHLDPGTVSAVGNLLLQGMSVSATRKALGISPNTWATWIERGTGDDIGTQRPVTSDTDVAPLPQSPYSVLVYVVDNSQAIMELRAVKGWTSHFERDWKAAQAYLVARNPDEWNPTTKTTVDTTNKVDVSIHRPMDADDLLEVAAILARQSALPKSVKTEVIGTVGGGQPEEGQGESLTQGMDTAHHGTDSRGPEVGHPNAALPRGTQGTADHRGDPDIHDAEIVEDPS